MSRSGYSDDCDDGLLGLWRGAVASATRGKRGQQALKEILQALDAMPVKELISDSLATSEGEYCTLGALGASRGLDMSEIDPDDWGQVSSIFNIAPALAREIVYENDEALSEFYFKDVEICGPMRPNWPEYGSNRVSVRTPAEDIGFKRWQHMRNWANSQIRKETK